jgi:hypothetical protein
MLPFFSRLVAFFSLGALCLAAVACAPSLRDPNDPDKMPDDIEVRTLPGPPVSVKEESAGVFHVRINASNKNKWVYYAFGKEESLTPELPTRDESWHLAFRRYFIKSNSGISGIGETTVALLRDQAFEKITQAPKEGYLADEKGKNDQEPLSAFGREGEWYYYDLLRHVLSPRPEFLYIVKTKEQYYKVQMLKYYDDNGNSGFPSFRYAAIAAP